MTTDPTTNSIDTSLNQTVNQISQLSRHQWLNIKSHRTLGNQQPKRLLKRNGHRDDVQEDCVENTGHFSVHS